MIFRVTAELRSLIRIVGGADPRVPLEPFSSPGTKRLPLPTSRPVGRLRTRGSAHHSYRAVLFPEFVVLPSLPKRMRNQAIPAVAFALAVAATAQTQISKGASPTSEWKPGACKGDPLPPRWPNKKPTLDQLHDILHKYPEPHDAYLALEELGNEETVPLLLERLRLDYGATEPTPPPGTQFGFICTQVHLVNALRSITNTDQGMYYPRWAAWWEANGKLPRERWILDGFAAAGLHAVEPMDERFGLELIEVLAGDRSGYSRNARRLLSRVPAETRARWLAHAAESDHRALRLGALDVLSQIDTTGNEDLLRKLAADSDLEVRRQALGALNERLRAKLAAGAPTAQPFCRMDPKENHMVRAISFAGDLLVLVYDDRVFGLDPRTLRKVWTHDAISWTGGTVLGASGQVFLASQEGTVLALDGHGKVLWRRELGDQEDNEIRLLIWGGGDIVVVRGRALERLDSKTGATKSASKAADYIRDADSAKGSVYFADRPGVRLMDSAPAKERLIPDAIGLSVTREAVCVTSGRMHGGGGRLTCLNPDTLSGIWSRPIGDNGTWGHDIAPIQDGKRVLVPTDRDLTAFSASDGALLWTTEAGQESHGHTLATDYGLLLLSERDYHLELRDAQTGEVRRVWPQIQGVFYLAVRGPIAAVVDLNETLWLVDLREPKDQR